MFSHDKGTEVGTYTVSDATFNQTVTYSLSGTGQSFRLDCICNFLPQFQAYSYQKIAINETFF